HQIAAVIEAAMQLSPKAMGDTAFDTLRAIVDGAASVDVGLGVLMWFQAGAAGGKAPASMIEVPRGEGVPHHVYVTADPAMLDAELWSGGPVINTVVADALRIASGKVKSRSVTTMSD